MNQGPARRGRPGRRDHRRRGGPAWSGTTAGGPGGVGAARPDRDRRRRGGIRTACSCTRTACPPPPWSPRWSAPGSRWTGWARPPPGGCVPGAHRSAPGGAGAEARRSADGAVMTSPDAGRVPPAQRGPGPRLPAGRTLPLRVEAIRQLRRRRTMVAFAHPAGAALDPGRRVRARRRRAARRRHPGAGRPGHRPAGSTSRRSASSPRRASCSSWRSPCSAGTPSPARRAGRRCGTCSPRRCRGPGCCGRSWSWRWPTRRSRSSRFPVMSLVAGTVAFGWHPLRLPGTGVELPPGTALGPDGHRARLCPDHRAGRGRAGVPALGVDRLAARRGRRRGRPGHRQQHPGRGDRAAAPGARSCPRTGSSPGSTRCSRRSPGAA